MVQSTLPAKAAVTCSATSSSPYKSIAIHAATAIVGDTTISIIHSFVGRSFSKVSFNVKTAWAFMSLRFHHNPIICKKGKRKSSWNSSFAGAPGCRCKDRRMFWNLGREDFAHTSCPNNQSILHQTTRTCSPKICNIYIPSSIQTSSKPGKHSKFYPNKSIRSQERKIQLLVIHEWQSLSLLHSCHCEIRALWNKRNNTLGLDLCGVYTGLVWRG